MGGRRQREEGARWTEEGAGEEGAGTLRPRAIPTWATPPSSPRPWSRDGTVPLFPSLLLGRCHPVHPPPLSARRGGGRHALSRRPLLETSREAVPSLRSSLSVRRSDAGGVRSLRAPGRSRASAVARRRASAPARGLSAEPRGALRAPSRRSPAGSRWGVRSAARSRSLAPRASPSAFSGRREPRAPRLCTLRSSPGAPPPLLASRVGLAVRGW